MMSRFAGAAFFLILNLLSVAVLAQVRGLDSRRSLSQYKVEHITDESGLSSNSCWEVFQDAEGYIWITSYMGLVRTDGTKFKVFDKTNLGDLPNDAFRTVIQGKDGTLYFGMHSGILVFRDEKWVANYTVEHHNLPSDVADALAFDEKERLWAGTAAGLAVFDGKKFVSDGLEIFQKKPVSFLNFDHYDKRLWIAAPEKGLFYLKNDVIHDFFKEVGIQEFSAFSMPCSASEGDFWFGIDNKLLFYDRKSGKYEQKAVVPEIITCLFFESETGSLWIGTKKALFRLTKSGELSPPFVLRNVPVYDVTKIIQDREGNLWVTTYPHGLVKISNGKFTPYGDLEGISVPLTMAIQGDMKNNTVYVATENGVFRKENGKFMPDEINKHLKSLFVKDIFLDGKGRLWAGTQNGLCRKDTDGKTFCFGKENGLTTVQVRFVFEDKSSNIWAGTGAGLFLLDEKSMSFRKFGTDDGLENDFILHLFEDSKGKMWVSTRQGIYIREGEKFAPLLQNGKTLEGVFFGAYEDKQGRVWVGTSKGSLMYFQNYEAKFSLKEQSTQYIASVFAIVEDNFENFWLSSNAGIIFLSRENINKLLKGEGKITPKIYGKADGLRAAEPTGNGRVFINPADGHIWFPLKNGIAEITPESIQGNPVVPNVFIEDIFVDDVGFNVKKQKVFEVEAGINRIEIHFTALSLTAPQKVRFRYKLEGFDNDWRETGNVRSVSYTNLDPKAYTFRVLACNNDGVWNEVGASIAIVKKPFFWQTKWFWVLVFLLVTTTASLIVLFRLRELEAGKAALEKKVEERTLLIKEQAAALQAAMLELQEKNAHLEQFTEELNAINNQLNSQKQHIMDSINNAKSIQATILPQPAFMERYLDDYFVLYKPKDIVSGDFYWFGTRKNRITNSEEWAFAVADCTGHGVPGALLSMIGMESLTQILKSSTSNYPNIMLEKLDRNVKRTLNRENENSREGMEIALCLVNFEEKRIYFSGAKLSAIIFTDDGEMQELKPTRKAINDRRKNDETDFELQIVEARYKAEIFLMSDGLKDQFNAEKRKFSKQKITELLQKNHHLPMSVICAVFEKELHEWRGNEQEQLDDITLFGLRLHF